MLYLNFDAQNKAFLLENFLMELNENIFSISAWTKEHLDEIRNAIKTIQNETKKEKEKGIQAFKKNYKEDYEFIKFHKIPFLMIANTYEKFKELFEKLKIDKEFKKYDTRSTYQSISNMGPCTLVAEISDEEAKERFNPKSDKKYNIPFIVIPERTFFEKFLLKGDMLGFFTHPLWIKLETELSIYHEMVEFYEFSNKRFHLGNFFIEHKGDFYKYGNHYSIFVLVKEAVVLNKFKHLKAIKVLRDFRLKYEWRIIKAKTGIDLSKLTKITPEIIKKLENVKPEKFGNVEGLYLPAEELKYYPMQRKNQRKNLKTDLKVSSKSLPKNLKILN